MVLNNAYGTILNTPELGQAFIQAANLIKSKTAPAKAITMQFLQLFECNQYTNPDFVIELYQLLTEPKQRKFMIDGIKGK